MRGRCGGYVLLGGLAVVWAYAVFQYGGVLAYHWNPCLVGLWVLALVYRVAASRVEAAPALSRPLRWLVVLLPGYAALQLVPLPLSLLKILSPARASITASLAPVLPGIGWAPLSVLPSATLAHVLRLSAYALVFLLVRECAWRLAERPWAPVFPIVVVAALEAGLGLVQVGFGAPDTAAHGTYVNRNHFAGLLEMALPFAVMYGVVRVRRRKPVPATCGVLGVAGVIFVGIIYSLSRMGFVAALVSLFVLAAVGAVTALDRRRMIAAGLVAAGAVAAGFVYFPPDQLIRRFAQLSSSEQITAEGRLLLWKETLSLVAAYPVFGCGLGGYEPAFLRYKVSEPLVNDDHAHNDYLEYLAEMGAVGLALAAALVVAVAARAVRVAGWIEHPEARYLGMAAAGALAALGLHSFVDFNLAMPANAMLLAWISGIAVSAEFAPRTESGTARLPVRPLTYNV